VYDDELAAGVRRFQDLHGLEATGLADEGTLSVMNVPLEERIRQVALNLERWRWLPDDLGDQHLLVNIPHYTLIARENGRDVMDIRVVVGSAGANATPVFSSEMSTVVFSPYWNIPESIAEGETVPAAARDETYLARNDIEILRVSGNETERVSAADVNWNDQEEIQQLVFRQRPGANNALGHVKFLFPNPYSVYLHDTPADNLFGRRSRALSHGCVRVEEPETLAKYVLRGDPDWDEPRIFAAMHAGVEKHVKLRDTLPVHLVYFTAWADERGLHFRPDVYGYDRKQR
jgi:murein L,D-transpeptidase YcbB/YkuD